jgi:hypothetical protein
MCWPRKPSSARCCSGTRLQRYNNFGSTSVAEASTLQADQIVRPGLAQVDGRDRLAGFGRQLAEAKAENTISDEPTTSKASASTIMRQRLGVRWAGRYRRRTPRPAAGCRRSVRRLGTWKSCRAPARRRLQQARRRSGVGVAAAPEQFCGLSRSATPESSGALWRRGNQADDPMDIAVQLDQAAAAGR